jgi:hypothetical protein
MGKGGGSQPQVSTAYQTNLPEYAKPYVQNMLGAAQNQLFTTSPGATTTNPDGTTTTTPGEITGFKPYSPYSNDPTKYFAGPSNLQQGVYNEAGQMQTPGAYGQAQGMAGMSGMGQFGTARQAGMYGQQGAGLGQLGMMGAMPAFGAGQQFASQVTDPNAMAQYMSPYQQNVTDIAKMNAVREAQMAGNQANLGAARQGTYGGARQALAGAERERNLLSNLSNIQAQGSQSAYDRALAQQQFGANLGLQGIQTGLQGVQAGMQGVGQGLQGVGAQQAGYAGAGQAASTLGQLGGAQQQADLARLGFQQQTGKEQQGYQQNIINQAIQDYATQQQYPYMQLSTMSNLLRGLPMQGMTTQQYQAAPSAISQLGGLGATALGAYGMAGGFKGAEGGVVPGYAGGGSIKGYAGPEGSLVGSEGATGVAGDIERQLMGKEISELIQIAKTNPSERIRDMAGRIAAAKQSQQEKAQSMGLASAPAPNMDSMGMDIPAGAGGGIVAFAGPGGSLVGGLSEEDQEKVNKDEMLQRINLMNRYFTSEGMGGQSPEAKAIGENITDIRKGLGDYDSKNFFRAVAKGGTKAMQSTSPNAMVGLGAGFEGGLDEYIKGDVRKEDLMNKLRTGEIDLAKLNSTERNNLFRNITSAITADEATKARLEGVKYNTAIKNIESGKRDDARKTAQEQRDETAIQGLMKFYLGNVNQMPTAEQVEDARRKAIKTLKANPLGLERS